MTSKIKITFLGTGSAIPTASRNSTGILLSYGKENILVDCGEGIQRQFRKAKLSPQKLTKILITHWHGDHILGIPGLLQTLALDKYKKTLCIFGPQGTKRFMKKIFEAFVFVNKLSLKIIEVKSRKFFENSEFYLETFLVQHHKISSNAYVFVKKGQLRIDKAKLKELRLPSGKHLQNLKKGKDVFYNGKKYFAKDLTFLENSKKISFVLDTKYFTELEKSVKDSDLLIADASFESSLAERASESYHMTARQAGELAKNSNSKKLILVHVSQRHEKEQDKILKEAKKIFKNSKLPKDLDVIEV